MHLNFEAPEARRSTAVNTKKKPSEGLTLDEAFKNSGGFGKF